jgi:hypothetical protein
VLCISFRQYNTCSNGFGAIFVSVGTLPYVRSRKKIQNDNLRAKNWKVQFQKFSRVFRFPLNNTKNILKTIYIKLHWISFVLKWFITRFFGTPNHSLILRIYWRNNLMEFICQFWTPALNGLMAIIWPKFLILL